MYSIFHPAPAQAQGIFGSIKPPIANDYFNAGNQGQGLFLLISNILKFSVVIAVLFFVFQLISSGYMYLSANGDTKKTELAFAKIWQGALGLIITGSAFVIAGVIGRFLGFNILQPTIYGPQ